MRWIDFENKNPTEKFEGWEPWTKEKWETWLADSKRIVDKLAVLNDQAVVLHNEGKQAEAETKIKERNKLIDDNSSHWGKLKPWLLALSFGKCWFTEAKDIASHKDIEHFRPKKEALDLKGNARDGYWWLAFDYTNFRVAGNVPNRKKGGWFPLHAVSHCSRYEAKCEESELPYLLDPINSYDVGLLAFDEEGNAVAVPTASEWERERVEVSIQRLKLNEHDELPEERRKVWRKTSNAIKSFLDAKKSFNPTLNPLPKVTMEAKAREIYELTRPDAQLSSVARWCVLLRNDVTLSRLMSS